MRIINSPPFVTNSLVWQEQPEQWTLTVVCKATFSLTPGTAKVALEPDGINDQDNHWDDDPRKSVYAPSDLVPYKLSPEVLLVGSAYAPRGEPVRSLFARMIVGQLDKSIEVCGQRTFTPDGSLVEGPRWTQMSLRYERASSSEGSWNPVGVDSTIVDTYGRRSVANLQPPAFADIEQGAVIPAVGFGPIAARWPTRQEKLGALASAFSDGQWVDTPLGMNFDGSYFQSAPLDQFVEEIRADETIVLENLHPDIERLVTRLPGIKPRTKVEIEGLPPWELTLVADTLWIDTKRAACTVTFRGQLPLDGRDQPGTIYIGVEVPGEPVRFPDAPGRARLPSIPENHVAPQFDDFDLTQTNADALGDDRPTSLPRALSQAPALPWDPGAKPPPAVPPLPPLPPKNAEEFGETNVFPAPVNRGRSPTWLGSGASPTASKSTMPTSLKTTAAMPIVRPPAQSGRVTPPPMVPPVPIAVAPSLSPQPPPSMRSFSPTMVGIVAQPPIGPPIPPVGSAGTTFGQAAVLAAAKVQGARPPPVPSSDSSGKFAVEKDGSRAGKPDPRMLATAAFIGAAEASNAAATTLPEEKEDKLPFDRPSTSSSGPSIGRTLVDLLWFDAALPPRIEENSAWKRLLDVNVAPSPAEEKKDADGYVEPDLNRPQKKPSRQPPEKTAEQKAKEDKSRVSKVISSATPTVDVENALYSAINDDGVLEAPLCLLSGEIELPFDEVETLKVLASAAGPLAIGDKKLKEAVDLANEAQSTPLGQSPEVAANFSLRIREAWTKANRMLPSDYLDVHSRRVLLEQRKYQMRELVGAQWIRAVLHGVSGDKPIPTYLPADLSKKLPLFTKFSVRLIVEVLPQQDQNETHPIALRVQALARTITARPRR